MIVVSLYQTEAVLLQRNAAAETDEARAHQHEALTQLAELLFHHPTLLRRLRRAQRKQQGNGLSLN